jgi:hypothetical protein
LIISIFCGLVSGQNGDFTGGASSWRTAIPPRLRSRITYGFEKIGSGALGSMRKKRTTPQRRRNLKTGEVLG